MMFIDLEQRNYTILLLEKEKCVHFLIDYFLNMVYQYRDEETVTLTMFGFCYYEGEVIVLEQNGINQFKEKRKITF